MRRTPKALIAGLGVVTATAVLTACNGDDSPGAEGADPAGTHGGWAAAPAPPKSVAGYQGLSAHVVDGRITVVAEVDHDQSVVKVLSYDPTDNRWTAGGDSEIWWRYGSARAATDDEIVMHGGCCGPAGSGSRALGFAYDVGYDRWRETSAGPLGNRSGHSAVWTGHNVIFWGGANNALRNDGAAYDPDGDDWRAISSAPIEPRRDHVSVWTGEEMIIWGGTGRSEHDQHRFFRNGAAYDPNAGRWRPIPNAPISPQVGSQAEPDATDAVWTGREMIVWNGQQGAAYDPAANVWRRIAAAPGTRLSTLGTDSAVWTGEDMIIWGGVQDGDFLASGAAYDPQADRWQHLPEAPLEGRDRHAAVWTPDGMLVWGGCCRGNRYFNDGAFFSPE